MDGIDQSQKIVDLELMPVHETEKAILLSDGKNEVWLPKSQVQDNGDGTYSMPYRLAYDKGLL